MDDLLKSTVLKIFWTIFLIVSLLHIGYAVYTYRGVLVDGSIMLTFLNFYSNDWPLIFYDDIHPRFFISALLQLPLLILYAVTHIANKFLYMGLFTFNQIAFPIFALMWNVHLTKRTKNVRLLFANLLIYAVFITPFSLNSYIQSILGINLCFVLWNYLSANMQYKKTDVLAIVLLSISLISQYEYMAYLGVIFFIASLFYAKETKYDSNRKVIRFAGIMALIAAIYTSAIIIINFGHLHNELSFYMSYFVNNVRNLLSLYAVIFSCITLVLLIFVLIFKKIDSRIILLLGIVYVLAFAYCTYTGKQIAGFYHNPFSSITYITIPFVFLFLLKKDKKGLSLEFDLDMYKKLFYLVFVCLIFQTLYQMVISYNWDLRIQIFKNELLAVPGNVVKVSQIHREAAFSFIPRKMYTTYNILLSKDYKIKPFVLDDMNSKYNMYVDAKKDIKNPAMGNFNIFKTLYLKEINNKNYIKGFDKSYKNSLAVIASEEQFIKLPDGVVINVKNKFWDLTDCVNTIKTGKQ